MLDRDLADLYQVPTRRINEQVKRNLKRFPEDFMFQLSREECDMVSRSQNATLKQGSNLKYQPYAFTEYGIVMLSSVLKSDIAIEVNKCIIKAFIELRNTIESIANSKELKIEVDNLHSKMKSLEMTQIVDRNSLNVKMTDLSKQVKEFATLLNEFHNKAIIIQRPDEQINE